MIEAVRNWLISIVAASFLVSMAQSLIPEGTIRKISGLVGGLVLLLTLTKPLLGADFEKIGFRYADYASEIQQRQTELESESEAALEQLIAEKTEAYILDKAAQLHLTCKVHVQVEQAENGTPVPAGAEITGQRSEALENYIEQELGIPKERQVYHGAT